MRDARSGEQIRERRWKHVRRVAAWHDRFSVRHPRIASLMNSCVRGALTAYTRMELPRGVGLMEAAIAAMPGAWARSGERECCGLWHGGRMRLDLADYYQRLASYLGRYHEVPLQLLIRCALRSGDTFIDGGANNGLVSMAAAWRVGPSGKVWAFEPNPPVYERLRWHAEANGLSQIAAMPIGLSDKREELELLVPGRDNLGAGTCAPLPERYGGEVSQRGMVRLVRADEAGIDVRGELMAKLDVEGFELRALRGMTSLIERHQPLVVCEMNAEMLRRAGASIEDVCGFMLARGYRGFGMDAGRAIARVRRLILTPLDLGRSPIPFDVAWIHPESQLWGRLAPCIAGGARR